MTQTSGGRTVQILVRDRDGKPLTGALISFELDGKPAGTVPNAEGRASIHIPDRKSRLAVTVSFQDISETKRPAQNVDVCVFQLDVRAPSTGNHMQYLAIAIGLILILAGAAGAFLNQCLTAAQALVVVIVIALGAGVMFYGFLRSFSLNVTVSGITAAGSGAVFVIIYLIKPTVLPTIICTPYVLPLRVVEGDAGIHAVPMAKVEIRDRTTSVRVMNSNGEDTYPFSERELGHEVVLIASAAGYADSQPKKATLEVDMKTVELHLVRISAPASSGGALTPTGSAADDSCAKPQFAHGGAVFQVGTGRSTREAADEVTKLKKLFLDYDLDSSWSQALIQAQASGGANPYVLRVDGITVPAGRALCRWLRDCKGRRETCDAIP